jgi:hypothetical protein
MSEEVENCENVFLFKDRKVCSDPFLSYIGDRKEKPDQSVIVMDNGKTILFILIE